jgi:proline iminopeptidase
MTIRRALRTLVPLLFAPALLAAQTGFVTTSDSAHLYYRIIGHAADTIIAIHGGPGIDHESIFADFAPLGERHTVIFYDQRGGGKSTLPTDTTTLVATRQIQDLDELRRHFKLERVTLVAHSYGPLLAASYAIAHPNNVKRMVFFGPIPPRRGDFFTVYGKNLNARLDSAQRAKMREASRMMTSPTGDTRQGCHDYWAIATRPRLAEPDRSMPLLKSDICAGDPAGIRYGNVTSNHIIMGSYGDWDLRPQLRTVQVPLLVVHGEQETIPMDLVQEWVTSMPNATLFRVPRAAHYTFAERPELVWPVVEAFLAGRKP